MRVSPLVAVRPETRTLGLEAINIPGLGRRPKAVFTISEQPNDKVPAQSVGIVRIALIPDRLLAVPCQLHQAQFVGAEPECPVLILLNGHNSGRRIRRQSRALERIHRDFAARRINTGQITAGPQTHPNHSSAVLKRLCRETRAAELPSRTCLKPDVPRDLAGAPIESKEARTTGDPKRAVSRGQRRDDTLFANRGIVPRPVTSRFRRDRIQSCYAVVCCEPHEPILILADMMGDRHGSACLIGRSVLLEAPRRGIVQAERVVSTDPYPSRAVFHQGLGNDETDALRILAIRNPHETVAVVAPQSICRTEPEKPVVVLNHPFHQETRGWPG